mgnify:CR=1 FL=1
MELPDFVEFAPFNKLREKMDTDQLGYFELFDPVIHLTGSERSELENGGVLRKLDELRFLPDNTLAIKNSRVLIYNPDESWYRNHREFPTYHVARCASLEASMAEQAEREFIVTTRISVDYDLFKMREGGVVTLAAHGFVVCKDCLHKLRYRDYDQYRNRKRGYSQKVLNEFRLQDFFNLYPMYPLSFGSRPVSSSDDSG